MDEERAKPVDTVSTAQELDQLFREAVKRDRVLYEAIELSTRVAAETQALMAFDKPDVYEVVCGVESCPNSTMAGMGAGVI